jgi:hypothetical protein
MLFRQEPVSHHASVFVHREGTKAIVVTMHYNGSGGVLIEDDAPVVLTEPLDTPDLGAALTKALRATQVRRARNLRDRKLTEWPAFRASGVRSVRGFERDFIHLQARGANEANLIYIVEGSPSADDLAVSASIASHAEPLEVTSQCLRVWRACRDR